MGCGGFIRIEECEWAGLMDDPVNIHGTCVRIVEILSPTRIKCKFMHEQSQGMEWGRKNEKVGFIENQSMIPPNESRICVTISPSSLLHCLFRASSG